MTQENKALVRRLIEEVWNQGNLVFADEHVAGDYVGQPTGGETHGPEGYKGFYRTQRAAFPDIHYTIEDQISEGDRVATRWTARATHTGEYQGIPPTGNTGTVSGITIYRIASGKLVQGWTNYDALGMLQQLGVIPEPGHAATA